MFYWQTENRHGCGWIQTKSFKITPSKSDAKAEPDKSVGIYLIVGLKLIELILVSTFFDADMMIFEEIDSVSNSLMTVF